MIHADAHVYEGETPSVELVGSVYADDGCYSLVAYLLITGLFLGVIRRWAASKHSPLQWHISYLNFALFGGLSAEAGIVVILYVFLLAFGANLVAHLAVVGICKTDSRGGLIMPHSLA
jgi:hypothetical protein